jgi:hypothetical protein
VLSVILILFLLAAAFILPRPIGPYRSYRADLIKSAKTTQEKPGVLKVGVAKRDITPLLTQYDQFVDKDKNNRYDPEKGDSFTDSNGNDKLDAVWMAGFSNNRPAQGVHDQLWARAIAFENNGVKTVMVTLDSIGIFHENIIAMRKMLNPALNIDQLMVSCLHNHEAPDTMGIWSIQFKNHIPISYFDHGYMEFVKKMVVEAAEEAVGKLQPAEAILVEAPVGPEGFMDDSRKPLVYDNVIRCARFVKPGTEDTIGTLLVWGNHAETLGSDNPLLTSDFCNYWRDGVENGVRDPNGERGFGGMCLYFQGMVGGLMTQLHTTVPNRNGGPAFQEGSYEKAQALGENLALVTLKALRSDKAVRMTNNEVAVVAKTIFVPAKPLYSFAAFIGLVHPGWYWGKAKSEVDAYRIGDIEILTIPGELYPEIAEGGIEAPAGQDFPIEPQEVPPLRSQMKGKVTMIMGLANDEIGYIIPKSQWDDKPPYAYGRTDKPQYGEENSFGPDAAPTIHAAAISVLEELHNAL